MKLLFIFLFFHLGALAQTPHHVTPENRVASMGIAEDFINQQLATYTAKAELVKDLKISLDQEQNRIYLRGHIQIPVEEMKAVNLDPRLGAFRFQVAIRPEATKKGYLILEFPLSETYFYPAHSKGRPEDRVIVPVQMLSLALASVRGYLAALSGDFSNFDRRTEKLKALIHGLDKLIAQEKNADAKEDLEIQRASLRVQLEGVPIERKQLENMSKKVARLIGFTGEKEIDLNQDLGARKNAIVFKIRISQIAPYLSGVELGGVRIRHDKKDGAGQNYLVIDINSDLDHPLPPLSGRTPANRPPMKVAPSLLMRLNQSLFESKTIVNAEKEKIGEKIKDLHLDLKDDGLHVSGKWNGFFFNVPFETIVDVVPTQPDIFEMHVRHLAVAGIDMKFLTKYVLAAMQERLELAMKGMCSFSYVGVKEDNAQALQVTLHPEKLVPAFPDLHVVDVDIREREFLLKIGRP